MFSQTSFVNVKFATYWTWMISIPPFCWNIKVLWINCNEQWFTPRIYYFFMMTKNEISRNLPGTPDAFGSLWTYFICSMSDSPLTHSFWQSGQHAGLGPPTKAVCWKAIPKEKVKNVLFKAINTLRRSKSHWNYKVLFNRNQQLKMILGCKLITLNIDTTSNPLVSKLCKIFHICSDNFIWIIPQNLTCH